MSDLFTIDMTLAEWIFVILAGILTGIINTLAGSGSLITLPIFIFIGGLSPTVANGTNRIGVLIQSAVGLWSYHKTGQTEFKAVGWLLIPSFLGAVVGAQVAVDLTEEQMNYTIGGLMVFMLLVLMVNPKRWIRESAVDSRRNRKPLTLLVFFLIGVYGGFIQAGVGIFLLAALVLAARYSLKAGNAIKLLAVIVFSVPALAIFFYHEQVHLGLGLLMAAAQSVGAVIGVRVVTRLPQANVWIHRLLIVIVLASAIKFLFFA